MTTPGSEMSSDALRERLVKSLGAQYALGRELGGGGMSRVFVAEETTLGRKVVVKVLSPTGDLSSERFAREIRLSARLQHPGIVPVLSAGVADGMPYYTMPYVAGESLRHRLAKLPAGELLPLSESVAVLRDVARALAFAHGEGVVHRDIKPENVLLSGDAAMVADFGVAKALVAARTDASLVRSSTLTSAGTSLGTPAYMSPEQAAGDPNLDARSDLYAFGLVAYEMIAGKHPFAHRQSVHAMVTAHLAEVPRPLEEVAPGTPPALASLVMRCLSKDAADRPEAASVLLDGLTTHRDPTASPLNRGVVTSSAGSASRRPSRSRVVLAMAVIIVLAGGAAAIWKTLSGPGGSTSVEDPAALVNSPGYDAYLRGRVKLGSENRQENEEAIRYLRQAVAADPNLAPAYAALARAYSIRAFYFAPDSEKKALTEDAQVAVDKALQLNPDLADGWFAKGLMVWTPSQGFSHEQAIKSYRRAISLNRRFDEAHHQLALVLLHVGLYDDAWSHLDSAVAIEPLNALARSRYGTISMYRGDYAQADQWFRRTRLETNPSLWVFQEADVLFRLGLADSASALISRFLAENPRDEGGVVHSVAAMVAAKAGRRAEADSLIERALALGRGFGHFHHTAYNIAVAETMLGRKAEAIRRLEAAADDGFPNHPLFATDSILAALRSEPGFIALLDRTRREMERFRAVLKQQ